MPVVHEDAETLAVLDAAPAEQARALVRWGLPASVIAVLVNSCESRCFFCANPGTTAVPASAITPWERLRGRVTARPAGVERLLVGGNEPMLHPDFDRLLAEAVVAGFTRIEVMTSGLRIDVDRLRQVHTVAVPLYAADAAIHDAVVGSTAYDRVVAGLDAALAAGITPRVHTIAMRRTLLGLPALARMVTDRWGTALSVAPLREKGDLFRYDDEAVPLDVLGPFLADIPGITVVGLPTCVAPAVPRGSSTIIDVYFRCQRRDHASVCDACADRAGCPGVIAAEISRRGALGLSPRPAAPGDAP